MIIERNRKENNHCNYLIENFKYQYNLFFLYFYKIIIIIISFYNCLLMEKDQTQFIKQKHQKYVLALETSKDLNSIGKYLTEHLKVAGAYWSLTSLHTLKYELSQSKINELVQWLKKCQNEDGGFGGNVGHDSHITSTHYAVLVLICFQKLQSVNIQGIIQYVTKLQQPNGSFYGDKWGQIDTRFSYCGVSCLDLLGALDKIDKNKAAEYVLKCKNFDGAFGGIPGAQSHAAYVFCCVGTLKITGFLNQIDQQLLAKWLCQRQTPKGGFNGRPQKLPDVCYSWWIYSTFKMMGKQDWIDQNQLKRFILNCQDLQQGGIGDRPGNSVDVFHTFFGLAALSLLSKQYELEEINPTYAIPTKILKKLNKI